MSDHHEGERRKTDGMERAEARWGWWRDLYLDIIIAWLVVMCKGSDFLVGDVIASIPGVPPPPDGHIVGPLAKRLKGDGVIIGTDKYAKSARARNNAHKYELCRLIREDATREELLDLIHWLANADENSRH